MGVAEVEAEDVVLVVVFALNVIKKVISLENAKMNKMEKDHLTRDREEMTVVQPEEMMIMTGTTSSLPMTMEEMVGQHPMIMLRTSGGPLLTTMLGARTLNQMLTRLEVQPGAIIDLMLATHEIMQL